MKAITKERIEHYRKNGYNYYFYYLKGVKNDTTEFVATPVKITAKNPDKQLKLIQNYQEKYLSKYPNRVLSYTEVDFETENWDDMTYAKMKFLLEEPGIVLS